MKKIRVSKTLKITIMIVLMIAVGILGVLCLKTYNTPEIVTEEKVVYEYTQANTAEYAVQLRPNQVYEEKKLPEGRIYLTEFIDSINTYFVSSFKGSDAATIEGEYEIIAQVAGYMTEKEVKTDVWSKDFVLAPKQSFQGEGVDYQVEKTIKVNYHSYDEFAKSVAEVTKVNLPMELRIIMRGNMKMTTPYETIDKPILTSIMIPLGNSYFAITTEGEVENKDSTKETIETVMPPNQNQIIIYGVLIGIACILFIGTWLLLIPLTLEDINLKKMKKIFNDHGSRMVGVSQAIDPEGRIYYKIKKLEDLIKIADELEKPVLYQHNENLLEMNKFYVIDKEILYVCEIELQEQLPIQIPVELSLPTQDMPPEQGIDL